MTWHCLSLVQAIFENVKISLKLHLNHLGGFSLVCHSEVNIFSRYNMEQKYLNCSSYILYSFCWKHISHQISGDWLTYSHPIVFNYIISNVRILPFRVDFLGSQVNTANRWSYVKRSFRTEITINTTALLFLACSLASKPPASQLQAPLQEAVCLNVEIYLAWCSALHLNSPFSWC